MCAPSSLPSSGTGNSLGERSSFFPLHSGCIHQVFLRYSGPPGLVREEEEKRKKEGARVRGAGARLRAGAGRALAFLPATPLLDGWRCALRASELHALNILLPRRADCEPGSLVPMALSEGCSPRRTRMASVWSSLSVRRLRPIFGPRVTVPEQEIWSVGRRP